jgi:hypothetical protein
MHAVGLLQCPCRYRSFSRLLPDGLGAGWSPNYHQREGWRTPLRRKRTGSNSSLLDARRHGYDKSPRITASQSDPAIFSGNVFPAHKIGFTGNSRRSDLPLRYRSGSPHRIVETGLARCAQVRRPALPLARLPSHVISRLAENAAVSEQTHHDAGGPRLEVDDGALQSHPQLGQAGCHRDTGAAPGTPF